MCPEEFKQRFFPFHGKLYRIARTLLNNREDAEDILQETYVKLWNKRNELTLLHQPEAFCVTMVKNSCFDILRSRKKTSSEKVSEQHLSVHYENHPDRKIENKERLAQIGTWIDQLPEKQKWVIQLRGYCDCSLEEIELITGESAVNVRVLLSRARKTLKEKIQRNR